MHRALQLSIERDKYRVISFMIFIVNDKQKWNFSKERLFDLDEEVFCCNVRNARKGAAPGPSGMTCEHLQPILE